jgi:hypothetical protein
MRVIKKHKFFLISLVCLAGVAWQLWFIATSYMEYPVVSEVYVTKKDEVIPPAFNLCFPWIEMLPWNVINRTQDEWISISAEERKKISIDINNRFTVKQIFDLTHDMRNIWRSLFVRKLNSFETLDHPDRMFVEKFVKDDLICYKMMTMAALRKGFFYWSHQITYGSEPGMTLEVTLSKAMLRHVNKVVIFLSGKDEYPRGDGDFPITYVSSNDQANTSADDYLGMFGNASSVGITYAKTTIRRLPPPFNMRCFPYKKHEVDGRSYESHYDWIHDCVNNRTLRNLKKGSFTSTFRKSEPIDFTLMSKYDVWDESNKFNNKTVGHMLDEFIEQCNNSSPGISCISEIFTPALISTRDSADITFTLYDMSGPEMMLIFRPLTMPMDLYVQAISVVGAWLGMSCIDAMNKALTAIIVSGRSCNRMMRGY